MKCVRTAHVLALVISPALVPVLRAAPPAGYCLVLADEFNSAVAQAAFYAKALIGPQVHAIYQAGVAPPPSLAIQNLGLNQVQLSWSNGSPQRAAKVTGPCSDLPHAIPPYPIPATNPQAFYRARR